MSRMGGREHVRILRFPAIEARGIHCDLGPVRGSRHRLQQRRSDHSRRSGRRDPDRRGHRGRRRRRAVRRGHRADRTGRNPGRRYGPGPLRDHSASPPGGRRRGHVPRVGFARRTGRARDRSLASRRRIDREQSTPLRHRTPEQVQGPGRELAGHRRPRQLRLVHRRPVRRRSRPRRQGRGRRLVHRAPGHSHRSIDGRSLRDLLPLPDRFRRRGRLAAGRLRRRLRRRLRSGLPFRRAGHHLAATDLLRTAGRQPHGLRFRRLGQGPFHGLARLRPPQRRNATHSRARGPALRPGLFRSTRSRPLVHPQPATTLARRGHRQLVRDPLRAQRHATVLVHRS